jgi:Family of unknown function (DUF6288)
MNQNNRIMKSSLKAVRIRNLTGIVGSALFLLMIASAVLAEEIPDLTKGGKPISTGRNSEIPSIDWALGPLGVNGWGYSHIPREGGSDKARQLLITRVDSKGPSNGLLLVGDVIVGVDGKDFLRDVRKALAEAINKAETKEADGKLNLKVWRPSKIGSTTGVVRDVVIKIPVLGSYSKTAPFDCPKTERIIENAVAYMKANKAMLLNESVFGCVNALGLMATGRDDVMPMVKDFAHSLILPPGETLSIEEHVSMQSWNWSYRALFLSEYYLLTKDQAVLPTLDEYVTKIAMGQSGAGTWGHTFAARENTGYLHGYLGGYGALNQAGLTCMMALALGKKCGIENKEVVDAIKRGDIFFSYFIGKGMIPYGDDEPYATFDDNGRAGEGAIVFDFLNKKDGREFYSEMTLGEAPSGRDLGHTGCYWSHLWGGIGAARAGTKGLQVFMKEMDYIFTLERQVDGRFVYQGNTGQADKGDKLGLAKDTLDCTGARLLQLCVPRRKLYLTGKDTPTATHLTDSRIEQILHAGRLSINTEAQQALSKDEICALVSDPMPAIRTVGVNTLYERKINMVDTLMTMLDSDNRYARYGAAEALGRVGFQSKPAVQKLMTIIEKSDDTRMRICAINALWDKDPATGLVKVAGDAIPLLLNTTLKHTDDDPRRVMQYITAKALFIKYGLLKYHNIEAKDRPLLVPAMKAWLANQNSRVRQLVTDTVYDMLTEQELAQLWKDIYHSARHTSVSGVGRAGAVSTDGIELLAKHRAEEGMNLAVWYMRWQREHGSKIRMPMLAEALESYGANAQPFLPYLEQHLAYFKANSKPSRTKASQDEEVKEGDDNGGGKGKGSKKKKEKAEKEDPCEVIAAAIEKIKKSNDRPKLMSIKAYIDPKDIPYSKDAAKPTASAGAPITVRDADGDGSEWVTLDGSGSKDAEGLIVAYIWTAPSTKKGQPEQIGRGAKPKVSLPVGVHNLTLTVYDTDGYSATSTVTVTVTK